MESGLFSELIMMEGFWMGVKALVIFMLLVNIVPVMAWVERRGMALIQNRLGPNRIGPLGLLQSVADAVKFIFKEDRVPGHVRKNYYFLAPLISVVPAFMGMAVIPFASEITLDGMTVNFQLANLNVGLLYVFAIASLGVYGIIIAGWSSNSKYALYGSLRSTAQMISYELAMGLSVIGVILVYSTVDLGAIARSQGEMISLFGVLSVPKYGVILQPLGFIIFLICLFAETNRTPFDMVEGESEIVAGYHLEYGSMKFALFMMAEYINMTVGSALLITMYFGGWNMLPGMPLLLESLGSWGLISGMAFEWARVGFEFLSFLIKVGLMMWFFVWVRWTVPRFRYDQLMDFGWKVLLPLSLANVFLTAVGIYYFKVM